LKGKCQFCFQSGFKFKIDGGSAIRGITSAKKRCTDRGLLSLLEVSRLTHIDLSRFTNSPSALTTYAILSNLYRPVDTIRTTRFNIQKF